MQLPRRAINRTPPAPGPGVAMSAGRPAPSSGHGQAGFADGETRPMEIVLVTLRDGLAEPIAASLRNDPRCRLSRGDPVRTLHGTGPEAVDAMILDHLLYSEIYLNDLTKVVRRAVVLALLERSELLQASGFLMRADGLLFADASADHAFDLVACAMVGYCAMPADLGPGNPFSSQRLQRARTLGSLDMQILRMLGRGWSNREIARAAGISESRVKAAMRALLHKLSLANRTEAAVFYVCNRSELEPDAATAGPADSKPDGAGDRRL